MVHCGQGYVNKINEGVSTRRDMQLTFVFWHWGTFPTLSGLVEWALHAVEVWCEELVLSVNTDKTGLVAFTRRRKRAGFLSPRLFGVTLQRPTSVKYLG
jgi:hypothetical protein